MHKVSLSIKLILGFSISIIQNIYPWKLTVINTTDRQFNVIGKQVFGNATDWFTVPALTQASQSAGAWCLTEVNTDIVQPDGNKFQYHWSPGSCSDVRVIVERDENGYYKMNVHDWTDDASDFFTGSVFPWLQNNIEPILNGGFTFSLIIPNAIAASSNGEKISHLISNDQQTGISDHIMQFNDTVNNFLNKINEIGADSTDFLNKTGCSISTLQKTLPGVIKGDFNATLELMEQLDKIKLYNTLPILTKIKITYENILDQINNLNLKPSIQSAINLAATIKDLLGNIRLIIKGMPSFVINQNIIAPLQNVENDLSTLINQLNALKNEKIPSINEIASRLISGIVNNLPIIETIFQKIQKAVNQIILDANNLKEVIIPKFNHQISLVSELGNNLRDNLLEELKKPKNIALMIPPALAAVPGTAVTIISAGLWSPALKASSALILAAAQPAIKNVLRNLLIKIKYDDLLVTTNELIGTTKSILDQITFIIKTLNEANISIFPPSLVEILSTVDKTLKDANDVRFQATRIIS